MNVAEKVQLHKDRLRMAREKHGLSQFELSRLCGIGISQITRYENGITEPSATTLGTIAQVLNVSVDYLLGLSDTTRELSPETLRSDERQLLEAYDSGDSTTVVKLMAERVYQLEGGRKER